MEILRVMFPPKPSFTEKDVTDQAGKASFPMLLVSLEAFDVAD